MNIKYIIHTEWNMVQTAKDPIKIKLFYSIIKWHVHYLLIAAIKTNLKAQDC